MSKDKKNKSCKNCDEYKTGWQRAQADYLNLQKDVQEKKSEWAQMSELQVLEDFIPVYDNFKKAFLSEQKIVNSEQRSWVQGIEYIMKQYWSVLKNHGVEEIKTVGEMFNENFHEAVGEETDTDSEEGEIVKEIEGGYKKGNKIIKVAKVIVAK